MTEIEDGNSHKMVTNIYTKRTEEYKILLEKVGRKRTFQPQPEDNETGQQQFDRYLVNQDE